MKAAAGDVRFPWAQIIASGLGLLRLTPDQFWSMSFREFRFACGFSPLAERLGRSDLDRLMQLFPDQEPGRHR